MTATPPRPESTQARRGLYGLAEIADALGLSRQLVTVWRRRRSHGIPEPDAELASGPIWRGETIEPWIDEVRGQRDHADAGRPLDPALALRACRRVLRLAALLLENPVRTRLLSQALSEISELLPAIAAGADDELGRAVRAMVAPQVGVVDNRDGELASALRDRALSALPGISEVVRLCDRVFSDMGGAD